MSRRACSVARRITSAAASLPPRPPARLRAGSTRCGMPSSAFAYCAPRRSVYITTAFPRRCSSRASASAGNRWPPVPPAARAMVAFRVGAGMRSTAGRCRHYRRATHACPPALPDGVGLAMDTAPDLDDRTSNRGRWLGVALLLALVLLAVLRSSAGTRLDSFTIDEPWHIVAGTSYVRGDGFHLNPEHPPLVKLWVGAAMPADFRLRPSKAAAEKSQEREWVEQTMFLDNDARAAQARARIALWGFHGVLLLALGALLWRACGLPWAAGTLAFLALEPTVAAHLPVVMTDLPLALALGVAAVAAALLASGWRWRWAIACGVAMGLALAAKHSALAGLAGLGLLRVLAGQTG